MSELKTACFHETAEFSCTPVLTLRRPKTPDVVVIGWTRDGTFEYIEEVGKRIGRLVGTAYRCHFIEIVPLSTILASAATEPVVLRCPMSHLQAVIEQFDIHGWKVATTEWLNAIPRKPIVAA